MKGPKRLNPRQRRERYELLRERDGERCAICHDAGYYQRGPNQLEIDRLDPKKGYLDLTNLQLAHHDCNAAKNTRGRGKFHPSLSKTIEDVQEKKVNTVEMMKHMNAFNPFCRWLVVSVRTGNIVAGKKLLNDAAWKFGVTQQTIQRYVDAITSDEGPLRIDEASKPPRIVFRSDSDDEIANEELIDEEGSRRAVADSVG